MMEKITQKQFKNEVEGKNLALIGATMNVSASFINKLFAAIEAGEPSKLKISSSLIAKAHFTSSQYMKRGESFLYLKGYKVYKYQDVYALVTEKLNIDNVPKKSYVVYKVM